MRLLPDRRYTVDGFDATAQTVYKFDGCFWHGCPTCFPQRHGSHPRLLGRTMGDVFALRQQKHDLLCQHDYLARSIWECEWSRGRATDPTIRTFLQTHQTPRPLDQRDALFGGVPMPTNSTNTWKVTDVSSTTISRVCTLTSTNTAAIPSVIPRSSPNHLSTKVSTHILDSCAVPSYHPLICPIPCCLTDAVRNSRSRCMLRASLRTSMLRYSTRTSTTVITPMPNALSFVWVHPRARRGPPEGLPTAPHSPGLPFSRHASRTLC